ncbi:hypothetical protein ACFQ0M_41060 [Kitasatospora aburaviensis]
MGDTVDYFILTRTRDVAGANNLNDMNCTFGKVDIWTNGKAGTSDYTCEGRCAADHRHPRPGGGAGNRRSRRPRRSRTDAVPQTYAHRKITLDV